MTDGLFTLSGVVLGFFLGISYPWLQDRRTRESVRTLIRLELQSQKALHNEWWSAIIDLHTPNEPPENENFPIFFVNFLRRPLPEWSRARWDGLATLIVRSQDEPSIQRADTIYNTLRQIGRQYAQLTQLKPTDLAEWHDVNQDEPYVTTVWAATVTFGRTGD